MKCPQLSSVERPFWWVLLRDIWHRWWCPRCRAAEESIKREVIHLRTDPMPPEVLERILAAVPSLPASFPTLQEREGRAIRDARIAGVRRVALATGLIALALFLWTTWPNRQQQSLDSVLAQAIEAMSRPKTVHYVVTNHQIFQQPGKYVEVWETSDGRLRSEDELQTIVLDEDEGWAQVVGDERVFHFPRRAPPQNARFTYEGVLDRMRRRLHRQPLEMRHEYVEENGRRLLKVTGVWSTEGHIVVDGNPDSLIRYDWYFDSAYLLVREDEFFSSRTAPGTEAWRLGQTRENFEYDVPIPDELLTFQPPPGAKIVEGRPLIEIIQWGDKELKVNVYGVEK